MSGTQIRKIIAIVSALLSTLISIHLIGVYIYDGGYYEGVKGGSISIGVVATTPSAMDPFQYGSDPSTDLVYRFLFRSMVRYDVTSGLYSGDLMNCDLAQISHVTCILRDDAVWSDGTRIKIDDIIATIRTFGQISSQVEIRSLIASMTLTSNGDTLDIKTPTANKKLIEVFTYPIIRSDLIEPIRNGTISSKSYISSGPYVYSETVSDSEYGYNRITLIRNERWAGSTWLDKIHFKFFKDLSSLQKSTETLTVIIPPGKTEGLTLGSRFREYLYTNYEYFGVFINTRTMSRSLRNSIHHQIGTSSDSIIADHRRIGTIFLTGSRILPTDTLRSLPDILRELGYQKKSDLISQAEQIQTTVSGEMPLPRAKYWENKANTTLLFITEPTEEIVFTGKVPATTTSVTINNYTLQEFVPGNTIFAYKVSTASGTLINGLNSYTLRVNGASGSTADTETLSVYMSRDPNEIALYKKTLQDSYDATQNTPALIARRTQEKLNTIQGLQSLSDEYYYNSGHTLFALKIGYINGPQSTQSYAEHISDTLRLLGIKTELIPYGPKELQAMIVNGVHPYDLLVIGVSTEGSIANMGEYFRNSIGKKGGVNFADVANKSLDDLFMELQSTTIPTRLYQIQQDITKIMNLESFFVPISSPYHRIWLDRNIVGIPQVDTIAGIASLDTILIGASIKQSYIQNNTNKSILGWFTWLISEL